MVHKGQAGGRSPSGSLRSVVAALVAVSGVGLGPARAAEAPEGEYRLFDRFSLDFGGFYSTASTELRLDAESGEFGTTIDLEDDLGLDESDTLLNLGLGFVIGRRHEVNLNYWQLSREGTQTIAEEIEFGDLTFPVTADVTASFENRFLELSYTYWALRRPRAGFGVSLGVAGIAVEAALEGEAIVGGLRGGTFAAREEASADVPAPSAGLRFKYALLPKLRLRLGARVLPEVDVEDFTVSYFDWAVALDYLLVEHFGIGVAYTGFTIQADAEESGFRGEAEYTNDGIQLFGRLAF